MEKASSSAMHNYLISASEAPASVRRQTDLLFPVVSRCDEARLSSR